jgi:chemotaxis protein methyltransferase CheR
MSITDSELLQIIQTIRSVSVYDFSEYSEKSLKRRFTKVLLDYRITTDELLRQLRTQSKFVEEVAKKVTVNTTEMFRDPSIWFSLRSDILPKLAQKPVIRIWHAGCSTGQEVYSMIILLHEMDLLDKAELYATDLNTDAIDIARKGVYKYKFNVNYLDNFDKVIRNDIDNPLIVRDIPYQKYFEIDHIGDKIKINKPLLEKPIYAKHDLVKDHNIFNVDFDLIMCRNVIIYFNYSLQNKVFQLFYNSLCEDRYLMLGIHESILGPFSAKFEKRGYYYVKK